MIRDETMHEAGTGRIWWQRRVRHYEDATDKRTEPGTRWLDHWMLCKEMHLAGRGLAKTSWLLSNQRIITWKHFAYILLEMRAAGLVWFCAHTLRRADLHITTVLCQIKRHFLFIYRRGWAV